MRKALSLLFCLILVSVTSAIAQNNVLLIDESFETNGAGTRYTVSNGGQACGTRFFNRGQASCVTGNPSNRDGAWIFCNVDNDGQGIITFNNLDVSDWTNLRLNVKVGGVNDDFSGENYDNTDYVRFQHNNGSWSNIVNFTGSGNSDGFLNENGNGTRATVAMTQFGPYNIPDPTNGTLMLRVLSVADPSWCEIAFDDIEILADCALPIPTITTNSADGSDRICPGETVDLTTIANPGGYKWFKDGVAIANSNSQTITISATGTYKVELLSRSCNVSETVDITDFPRPIVTTISSSTGAFSECSNNALVLTADDPADDYYWEIDGVEVPGENGQSIDAIQYGSGGYQVFLVNEFECPTGSVIEQVTVINFTNPTITGDRDPTFCEDDDITLTSTPGAAYQWYINGNAITGATSQNLTVSYPDSGIYHVHVFENTGCNGASNEIKVSTLKSPANPTITATGSTVICERDSVKLSSTFAQGGYQWFRDGIEINGATNRIYYVKLDGDYQVEVYQGNGCSRITPNFSVTVYDAPDKPTLNVPDTSEVCRGGNVTIVSSSASSYQWFKNGLQIPNQTFQSLYVTTEGDYFVRVGDGNNCTEFSDTVHVRINVEDIANISTTDSTTFCPDDEAILTSNYNFGNSWFYNGVEVEGVNTVQFAARDVGSYFAVVNENGCTDTSNTIVISHFQRPAAPSISPGDTAVCDGSDITFTASGATNYQWYLDGVEITGADQPTYTATTSGKYACETVDNKGCTNRDTVRFTKFFQDSPTISPSDTTVCTGDAIILSSNYEDGNQWYLDGNAINGAIYQTYQTNMVGDYHIVVTLDNCVDQSAIMTLSNKFAQPKPTITLNGPNLYCAGDSSELVSSNAVQYQWLRFGQAIAGATGKRLYPKIAGDYQVVAFNQFGCTDTSFIQTINTHPAPIISSVDIDNNSCEGQSNGGFEATAAGGTDPKEFSIDGINWQSSGNYPNLGGGTYFLRLRDANNCKDSLEIVIDDNPTSLEIASAHFNSPCFGENKGEIYLSATGGQPTYQFSIDGINYGFTTDFVGLPTGGYVGYVKDNLGCIDKTDTMFITSPDELIVNMVLESPVTCADAADASVQVSALGGVPSYFFSMDNGATFQSSPIFSNLGPGVYTVLVEDLNGCQATSNPLEIFEPDTLEFVFANIISHVDCFGENTGLITVSATGGTGPYEYSIDEINFNNSQVISGLVGGKYVVTVRDARGCIDQTDTLEITEGDSLYINANVGSHVSCYDGEDGSLLAIGGGGTGALEYSIDLVNYFPVANFQDLPAGIYDNITVRDENGCVIFADPIEIEQPDIYELNLDLFSNITCSGQQDAVIALSSIGGAGGNTFSIDGGNTFVSDSVFVGLGAGNYNAVVKDMNGCTASISDPIVVVEPSLLQIDQVDIDHVTCNGLSNGAVFIYASGGTAPLTYSLNGGQHFETNPIFSGLAANNYHLIVKDASGCTVDYGPLTILQPAVMTASGSVTRQISCFGEADGQITLSAAGANGGYIYSIDGGLNFQGSPVFNGLAAGNYQFLINDNLDCQVSLTVQILDPAEITISSLQILNVSCNGANDGKILVNSVGGRGVKIYSIDGGNTYQTNGIFNNLGPGAYTLIIQDTSGCVIGPFDVPVTQPDTLEAQLLLSQPVVCAGANDGELIVQTEGGTRPYTYSLNGSSPITDSTFSNLNAGNYTATVQDANGCVINSVTVTLTGPPAITNTASVTQHLSCFDSNDGAILGNATGGSGNILYSLDPLGTFVVGSSFTNLAAGTYVIYAKDTNGCIKASNSVEILNQNPLNITASVDKHVSCFGADDAQITAFAVGGTNNFTYQLNNDPPVALPVFQNLAGGQYIVKVIDNAGCVHADTVFVNEPAALAIVIDQVVDSDFGQSNGFIRIDVLGGVTPYTYVWSNGGTTQDIFNLPGGTYTVLVRDANGCEISETIQVLEQGVGIEEMLPEFNMYPNPANNLVNLTWSSWTPKTLRVYNELGELVIVEDLAAIKSGSFQLELGRLSTGLYFVELATDGLKSSNRLMITK